MYALEKSQINLIETDVWNARITFSHLADELIDHICCEVENMMWDGKSFDDAYEIVKQQTGIKVLQKIQENTHYLIDKNYRIMKMTMKITGNISLAMLALGTVMKLFHWPGASIMLVLGFVVLCLIFFPSAIYTNYRDSKVNSSKLLHISILLGGVLFMIGVLFKVMHWPGAGALLLVGWVFILFVFLPILLFVKRKESTTKREKITIALGIIGLIIFELSTMFKFFHWPGAAVLMIVGSILLVSVFLPLFTYSKFKEIGKITGQYIFIVTGAMFFILFSTLLAINVSKDILGVFVSDVENTSKMVDYLEEKNSTLYADFNSKTDSLQTAFKPQISALHDEATKICDQIKNVKLILVMAAEDVDKPTAENLIENVLYIRNKSDFGVVNQLMIGENCNGHAYTIKQDLNNLKEIISAINLSNQEVKAAIEALINTPDMELYENKTVWEQYTFENNSVINALATLAGIEKNVRIAESQILQEINNQQ